MTITAKLAALLASLRPSDIERLAPAQRQHLGQLLALWAKRCEPPNGQPQKTVVPGVARKPRK